MLTKKDFKAVAKIFDSMKIPEENFEAISSEYEFGLLHGMALARDEIGNRLADYFATQNPRFDRERFMQACGLTE